MNKKSHDFENLLIPQFLISQMPFEDDPVLSNRLWLYCPRALSLIEVLITDNPETYGLEKFFPQKFSRNLHNGETVEFIFLLIQNNCEKTGFEPETLLKSAWEWFSKYWDWQEQSSYVVNKAKNN